MKTTLNKIREHLPCKNSSEYEELLASVRFRVIQNIEKIKPFTSDENYILIIKWLETGDKSIAPAAESAAWLAAWLAARSEPWPAGWTASWALILSAAYSASWAEADLAEWLAQESEFRRMLEVQKQEVIN